MKWYLAYEENRKCKDIIIERISDIRAAGYDVVEATVPGNVEMDLMRTGKLPPLYYSTNTLEAQKLENHHFWYFAEFELDNTDVYLDFEGIDTVADIYINGSLAATTDNMFLSYPVKGNFRTGQNEVVVHLKPVCIEARKYDLPMSSNALKYNYDSLFIRKASHMYGWDIMPRIVSAGIWKPVTVKPVKKDRIRDVFLFPTSVNTGARTANMRFALNTQLSGDFAREYSVRVHGSCRDSSFRYESPLWHTDTQHTFSISGAYFWWPKNYGDPDLYDTTVELYHGEELCDSLTLRVGIRTVKLHNREMISEKDRGEFCFEVNGKRIFVMGTNWVPLDALHSNDINRVDEAMAMIGDIGCNMIRCWGGNAYESDRFFELCDEMGIMVWQDFAMGCAVYPQDDEFAARLKEEAVFQIKRLRNHASIVLWAGDNECDYSYQWAGIRRDPNENMLTRQILKKACEVHDYTRPFLPSSPYMSEKTFRENLRMQEDHLWGPRDYFKSEYYKNTDTHFASEMGYHGFPSVKSLKKFLANPEVLFKEDGSPTDEYLVHAASPELSKYGTYAYRIRLAYTQVETLFGQAEPNLDDFVKQSQISQAEAKKYFIEKFRIKKWDRTGIIWWNLLDGWPQVSDAVVDYYYSKKLAYHFIKRSQQPVCLMFDEPVNFRIGLFGVNDLQKDAAVEYTVTDVLADKQVLSGSAVLGANTSRRIAELKICPHEKVFYLIRWTLDGKEYVNHYFSNIIDIDYRLYTQALSACGMDEFDL